MGYHSDIVLGIAFPDTQTMLAFAASQRVTGNQHVIEAIKRYGVTHMSAEWGQGVVLWVRLAWVKWRPNDPETQAHELLLEAAREAEYSTIFIEVGEEYADVKYEVEHRDKSDGGMLLDCFDLVREIMCPKISKPLFGETK